MSAVQVSNGAVAAAERPEPAPPRKPRGWYRRLGLLQLVSVASVLVAIAIWQAVVSLGWVDPLYVSSPRDVITSFGDLIRNGSLQRNIWISVQELLLGFGAAAIVGIPIGVLCGRVPLGNAVLSPFISGGWVMPRIALIPIVTLWFGIGLFEKIVVVFLMCVFPIIVLVTTGVQNISRDLLRVAQSLGGTRFWRFRTLILPASVPSMVAGLRLGFGMGVIGVVVSELYGSTGGLGYLLVNASANFQMGTTFAAIVVLVLIGMLGMGVLSAIEKRFNKWR